LNKNEIFDDAFSRTFPGLIRNGYATATIDVPQSFKAYDKSKTDVAARATANHGETLHYKTMTNEEIAALPIYDLLTENAVVLLWTSGPYLQIAMDRLKGWGLTFKTIGFNWVKGNPDVAPFKPQFGMGFWTRAGSEICLLATKGKPRRLSGAVSQMIVEPRREHSRKPDSIYDRVERLCSGPYLELFARQRREGWTAWGNEIDRF
jgi:N6-adenosine-specific RNA methylase IME4